MQRKLGKQRTPDVASVTLKCLVTVPAQKIVRCAKRMKKMKMKESYKMDEAMFQAQVMAEQEQDEEMQRQYALYVAEVINEESQAALPENKRDGYYERMAEMADIRRKELKENGQ